MAVVKYGVVVTEVKGKFNGAVFQRMGRSLGIRSNPSHKSTSTSFGLGSRVQFAQIASAWRGLSNAQKDAWVAASSTYPATDAWGNAFILTGYQLFIQSNRYLLMAGGSIVTTASSYAPPTDIDVEDDGFFIGSATCIVNWAGTIPTNHFLLFFVTNPYPPSTSFRNAKYHLSFALAAPGTNGANRYSLVNSSFRTPAYAGAMWGRYAVIINRATGCWIVSGGIWGQINA